MKKFKFELIGLSLLTASLVVAVGVTNSPVQKFLVDSYAKGRCVDRGSAAARNECIAGEKEAMDNIQKNLTAVGVTAPKFKDLKLLQRWLKQSGVTTTKPVAESNPKVNPPPAKALIDPLLDGSDRIDIKTNLPVYVNKPTDVKVDADTRLENIRKDRSDQVVAQKWNEQTGYAYDSLEKIREGRVIVEEKIPTVSEPVAVKLPLEHAAPKSRQPIYDTPTVTLTDIVKVVSPTLYVPIAAIGAIKDKIVEANKNPNTYNGNQNFNVAKTFIDDFIPDSYTNYWQGQVANAKPEDNLLDIAYNKGTTFDTMQVVTFNNFDEYVGGWQKINEQTYDPKLTSFQNYNKALEAGKYDKQTQAATIKLGTILATEAYVVGVAPQIVLHAASEYGVIAGGLQALGQAQVVSTAYQTGDTAAYCTLNGWDPTCKQMTERQAINWGTMSISEYANVANNGLGNALGRGANAVVSGTNLVVDVQDAVQTFKNPEADNLTKGMTVFALVGDVGGGVMDWRAGQLPGAPRVDVPDVNGSKMATPEQLAELDKLSKSMTSERGPVNVPVADAAPAKTFKPAEGLTVTTIGDKVEISILGREPVNYSPGDEIARIVDIPEVSDIATARLIIDKAENPFLLIEDQGLDFEVKQLNKNQNFSTAVKDTLDKWFNSGQRVANNQAAIDATLNNLPQGADNLEITTALINNGFHPDDINGDVLGEVWSRNLAQHLTPDERAYNAVAASFRGHPPESAAEIVTALRNEGYRSETEINAAADDIFREVGGSDTSNNRIPDPDPDDISIQSRIEKIQEDNPGIDDVEAAKQVAEENQPVADWLESNTQNGDIVKTKDGRYYRKTSYSDDKPSKWYQVNEDGTVNYQSSQEAYNLRGGEIVAKETKFIDGKKIVTDDGHLISIDKDQQIVVDSTEDVTRSPWEPDPQLKEKLAESPHYVDENNANRVLDEFEKQGGFDNPNLKRPTTQGKSADVVFFDFEGKTYAIKIENENAYDTFTDNLHGDQVIALEQNQPGHVAPTTIIDRPNQRYGVQQQINGREMTEFGDTEIVDQMAEMGIYMEDPAGNIIITEDGNWVIIDTGRILSAKEHDALLAWQKSPEAPTDMMDEYLFHKIQDIKNVENLNLDQQGIRKFYELLDSENTKLTPRGGDGPDVRPLTAENVIKTDVQDMTLSQRQDLILSETPRESDLSSTADRRVWLDKKQQAVQIEMENSNVRYANDGFPYVIQGELRGTHIFIPPDDPNLAFKIYTQLSNNPDPIEFFNSGSRKLLELYPKKPVSNLNLQLRIDSPDFDPNKLKPSLATLDRYLDCGFFCNERSTALHYAGEMLGHDSVIVDANFTPEKMREIKQIGHSWLEVQDENGLWWVVDPQNPRNDNSVFPRDEAYARYRDAGLLVDEQVRYKHLEPIPPTPPRGGGDGPINPPLPPVPAPTQNWFEKYIRSADKTWFPALLPPTTITPTRRTMASILDSYDQYAPRLQEATVLSREGRTNMEQSFEILQTLTKEKGVEVRLIDDEFVTVIENGKPASMQLIGDNTARISADGTILYVRRHPQISNLPTNLEDVIHDVGTILIGGKIVPDGMMPSFTRQDLANFHLSQTDINKLIDPDTNTVPVTHLFDDLIDGKISREAFDQLIIPTESKLIAHKPVDSIRIVHDQAEIRLANGEFRLYDTNSRNGTFYVGPDGEWVRIGPEGHPITAGTVYYLGQDMMPTRFEFDSDANIYLVRENPLDGTSSRELIGHQVGGERLSLPSEVEKAVDAAPKPPHGFWSDNPAANRALYLATTALITISTVAAGVIASVNSALVHAGLPTIPTLTPTVNNIPTGQVETVTPQPPTFTVTPTNTALPPTVTPEATLYPGQITTNNAPTKVLKTAALFEQAVRDFEASSQTKDSATFKEYLIKVFGEYDPNLLNDKDFMYSLEKTAELYDLEPGKAVSCVSGGIFYRGIPGSNMPNIEDYSLQLDSSGPGAYTIFNLIADEGGNAGKSFNNKFENYRATENLKVNVGENMAYRFLDSDFLYPGDTLFAGIHTRAILDIEINPTDNSRIFYVAESNNPQNQTGIPNGLPEVKKLTETEFLNLYGGNLDKVVVLRKMGDYKNPYDPFRDTLPNDFFPTEVQTAN